MFRRLLKGGVVVLLCAASAGAAYWFAGRASVPAAAPPGVVALVVVRSEAARPVPLGAPPTAESDRSFRRLQLALVRSRDVLAGAAADPKAAALLKDIPEPADWLAAHLTAEFEDGSDILRVGLTGLPRPDAAKVLNLVVGRYVDHANASARRALMERQERLNNTLTDVRQQLEQGRRDVRRKAEFTAENADIAGAPENLAALYQERTALRVAAAGAANEKGYAAALETNAKAIKDATRAQVRAFEFPPGLLAPLEAAESTLAAELLRLTVERGSEARVSVLELADGGKE